MMCAGLEVMLFGLSGVFAVLILFYISTKVMLFAAKVKKGGNVVK